MLPRIQAVLFAALLQARAPGTAALHTRVAERSTDVTEAMGDGDMVRVTFELPTSTVRIEVDTAAGTVTLDGWAPEPGHRPRVPVVALRRKSQADVWQDQSEQGGSEEIIARATAFVGETLGRDGFLGHAVVSTRNPSCLAPGQVAEARWTHEKRTFHSSGVLVNGTFVRAEDNKTFHCVGRCGKGCPDPSKPHSRNVFTQACLNHDFCLLSQVDNDCGDELVKSLGDYVMGYQDCADPGPFSSVGGRNEYAEVPISEWKANIRKALTVAKEALQGTETKIKEKLLEAKLNASAKIKETLREAKWNASALEEGVLRQDATINGTRAGNRTQVRAAATAVRRSADHLAPASAETIGVQLQPSEMAAYRAFLGKLITEEEEARKKRREAALANLPFFLEEGRSVDLPGMIPEATSDLATSNEGGSVDLPGMIPEAMSDLAMSSEGRSVDLPGMIPEAMSDVAMSNEATEAYSVIPEDLSAEASSEEASAAPAATSLLAEAHSSGALALSEIVAEVDAEVTARASSRKPGGAKAAAPTLKQKVAIQKAKPVPGHPAGQAKAAAPAWKQQGASTKAKPAPGHAVGPAKAAAPAWKQQGASTKAKPAPGHPFGPAKAAPMGPLGTVVNTLREADELEITSTTALPPQAPATGAAAKAAAKKAGGPLASPPGAKAQAAKAAAKAWPRGRQPVVPAKGSAPAAAAPRAVGGKGKGAAGLVVSGKGPAGANGAVEANTLGEAEGYDVSSGGRASGEGPPQIPSVPKAARKAKTANSLEEAETDERFNDGVVVASPPKNPVDASKRKSSTAQAKASPPENPVDESKRKSRTTQAKASPPMNPIDASKRKSSTTQAKATPPKSPIDASKRKSSTTQTKASPPKSPVDASKLKAGTAQAKVPNTARMPRKVSMGEHIAHASAEAGVVDVDPAADNFAEAPAAARVARKAQVEMKADEVLHEPFDSGLSLHEPASVDAGDENIEEVEVGARRARKEVKAAKRAANASNTSRAGAPRAKALNIAINTSMRNATKTQAAQALSIPANASRSNAKIPQVQAIIRGAIKDILGNASKAFNVAVNATVRKSTVPQEPRPRIP